LSAPPAKSELSSKPARSISLIPALACLKRIADGLVSELAQRTQQFQLVDGFDLRAWLKNSVGGDPLNGRKILLQRGEVFGRKKFHLDADLPALKLEIVSVAASLSIGSSVNSR